MSGGYEPRRKVPQIDEQELATKTIQVLNKRFYVDVKENVRGRFIKITEVAANNLKSRLIFSVPAALEFSTKLKKLIDVLNGLSPHDPKSLAVDGLIDSDTISMDNRRYYIDLRENERGRFLRVSMLSMGVRVHIAVPSDGISNLQEVVEELSKEYCRDEDMSAVTDLPEAKVLFAGNKTFYFDVGSNRYGVFLRISELRAAYRTAVTIPENQWGRFRDILNELTAKSENGDKSPSGVKVEGNECTEKKLESSGGENPNLSSEVASTETHHSEPAPITVA